MESERIKKLPLLISLTFPNHNWGFIAHMNDNRLYMGGALDLYPGMGMKIVCWGNQNNQSL